MATAKAQGKEPSAPGWPVTWHPRGTGSPRPGAGAAPGQRANSHVLPTCSHVGSQARPVTYVPQAPLPALLPCHPGARGRLWSWGEMGADGAAGGNWEPRDGYL